jgi:5-formyltetrahydrofolate cyclo-ligase
MPSFDATPTEVTALADAAKLELRKRMRAVRSAFPEAALAARSRGLVARALELPAFIDAPSVALFYPLLDRKEVDLRELDAAARRLGKRVYYPFLEQRGEVLCSGLKLTGALDELAVRGGRFHEPPSDAPVAGQGEVSLLFVPALALAPSGHRLGYGAGFYDSLLPDFRPPGLAIGVGYDFQLLAELPVLPHDVACDAVLTDSRCLWATPPGAAG